MGLQHARTKALLSCSLPHLISLRVPSAYTLSLLVSTKQQLHGRLLSSLVSSSPQESQEGDARSAWQKVSSFTKVLVTRLCILVAVVVLREVLTSFCRIVYVDRSCCVDSLFGPSFLNMGSDMTLNKRCCVFTVYVAKALVTDS